MLEIIYEDEHLIAINKPHGLLVHRTKMAADATEFAVQQLRNQIGYHVYPAHRLDRKTSGVLLFTKSKEINSQIQFLFREREITKKYEAILRGYVEDFGTIDYALTHEGKTKASVTHFTTIQKYEINLAHGQFPTSRYSHVELSPQTGRFHQLRKHTAHIFHPILGDRPHGCNKQNKLWKEQFNMTTMMLHARSLSFLYLGKFIEIEASSSAAFTDVLKRFTLLKV